MAELMTFTPRAIERGDREQCECCELWFQIKAMRRTDDGVWLCGECYEQLLPDMSVSAEE